MYPNPNRHTSRPSLQKPGRKAVFSDVAIFGDDKVDDNNSKETQIQNDMPEFDLSFREMYTI